MRISDWSSDVCPSDLLGRVEIDAIEVIAGFLSRDRALGGCNGVPEDGAGQGERDGGVARSLQVRIVGDGERLQMVAHAFKRSEERSVGKELVSTCRSRGSLSHEKKTNKK